MEGGVSGPSCRGSSSGSGSITELAIPLHRLLVAFLEPHYFQVTQNFLMSRWAVDREFVLERRNMRTFTHLANDEAHQDRS